ncbi:hypothetical protein JCM16358_13360 [Halanaerocella petrolearia]
MKSLQVAIISLVFILSAIMPALAQERANLQAKKVEYRRKAGIIIATGDVYLETEEVKLWANYMKINLDKEKLVATGQVKTKDETGKYTSNRLEYDLKTDKGIFIDAEGTIISDSIKDPFYLDTPKVDYSSDKSKLSDAQFTSCDLDKPHYHFQTEDMIIYPGDKIIAYHAVLWEFNGQIPIFYWPVLIYSLKNDQNVFQPQVGYSRQKGWFIKTTYNYYLDSNYQSPLLKPVAGDFGQLYVDYFSRLGFAWGFNHYYKTFKDDSASLNLYLEQDKRNENQSPWLSLEFNRHYEQADVEKNLNLKYKDHYSDYLSNPQKQTWLSLSADQTTTFDNWRNRLDLDYDKNKWYKHKAEIGFRLDKLKEDFRDDDLGIDLDYSYQEDETELNKYEAGLDYRRYLTDDLYLDYNYDYEHRKEEEDKGWQYDTSLKLKENKIKYDWWLGTEFERSNEKIDYYNLPEGELTIHPGRIWSHKTLDPLDITFGGVNRYDDSWSGAKQHGYYRLDYADYLQLNQANSLRYDQQFQQDIYSTGRQRWSYQSDLDLMTRLPAGWSNKISHDYHTLTGLAPEGFPTEEKEHEIKESLNWRNSNSELNINLGYDFLNQEYNDLTSELDYYFNDYYNLESVVEYDINRRQFEEFATTFKVDYDQIKYNTAFEVDLNTGTLQRWDNSVKVKVGPTDWQWQIGLNSSYYYADQEFGEANLKIEKRLHRRKVTLAYDHINQEAWFQYQLLAFPEKQVEFGTTDGGEMLFDGDLGDVLDEVE